jgi:GH24 family phage-related lysozyme (muramidase)
MKPPSSLPEAPSLDAQWNLTSSFEGVVEHMYLDAKGFVTCGVGFLLTSLDDALMLPFEPAHAIASDWARVSIAKPGKQPSFYAQVCSARLPQATMRAMFDARILGLRKLLVAGWPDFEQLPTNAQLALTDIGYNVGARGLLGPDKWQKLKAAIMAGDWETAARESNRRDVQPARNARTFALLLSCAGPSLRG